jgi:hypothetical protein
MEVENGKVGSFQIVISGLAGNLRDWAHRHGLHKCSDGRLTSQFVADWSQSQQEREWSVPLDALIALLLPDSSAASVQLSGNWD